MGPIDALKLALKKEEGAIELYKNMAAEHPALKDILTDLLNEELSHKKKIEEKIVELTRY